MVHVSDRFDLAVVGGGIVGLATARALLAERPDLRLVILEKEARLATHQTGHNSGVIHSGIYYKPGSHKARLCVEGARLMKRVLRRSTAIRVRPLRQGDRRDLRGRAAAAPDALRARHRQRRARAHAASTPDELREIEPHVRGGPRDPLAHHRHRRLRRGGARRIARELLTQRHRHPDRRPRHARSSGRDGGFDLATARGTRRRRASSSTARASTPTSSRGWPARGPSVQIIPFRGEYYMIRPERHDLVRGLIYPVPDPEFPFLGVHFTRTIHGEVEAGPNAVLAFAREGYRFGRIHAAGAGGHARLPRASGRWPAATGGWAATRCTAR